MLIDTISINNISSSSSAKHLDNIGDISSFNSRPLEFIHAGNVLKHFSAVKDKVFFQASADLDTGIETAEEKEQADYLFKCVSELINNPDCLLNSEGTKFTRIHVAENTYNVSTARVLLPSGNAIYAGFLGNRLIVSHGDIYHIETRLQPKITLLGSMGNLLAHLTGSHKWEHGDRCRPGWMDKVYTWYKGMRDPLVFPGANGQIIEPAMKGPLAVLYQAAAEIQAQLAFSNTTEPDADGTLPQHLVLALNQPLQPATTLPGPLQGRDKITFNINGHEMKLAPANKNTIALLAQLDLRLSVGNTLREDLSYLLELDALIAGKIAKIFYNGDYLKDKNHCLNIIILKSYTENIILKLQQLVSDNLEIQKRINEHLSLYKTLNSYIPKIDTRIADAYNLINKDIISETIFTLKNNDFASAEHSIIEKIHHALFFEKTHLKNILHTLFLLKEAHDEYSKQLVFDEISLFEKIKYINSENIFSALLLGENEELIDCLLKMTFYSIFEYTRTNGISIYSYNFLLPGEISEHWHLFSENEQEIDYSIMEQKFSADMLNYIYSKHDAHTYFDLIVNLVELSRMNEKHHDVNLSWHEKNIIPWQETLTIIGEIIRDNNLENNDFNHHYLWREDLIKHIRHDKTVFVLLAYITNLQQTFIQTIQYFFDNDIILQANTGEQFIAAAKIEAMKINPASTDKRYREYDLMIEYEQRAASGDFELMISAAVFWFFSKFPHYDETLLSSLHVLYVMRKFIGAQQYFYMKYTFRRQEDYTSVFELEPSDKKESLEDYYQQFYDYKKQYSLHEAQRMVMQAIGNSTVDYIDAIYPPKEIYSFKVFSRNYVTNSLSPFNYFSMPEENSGYMTVARLYSGKLILLSTLAGFVFISDLDRLGNDPLLYNLKEYWIQCNSAADIANIGSLSVNETVLALLFPTIDANGTPLTTLLDILLKAPEEDSVSLPQSPYSLVAAKGLDIFSAVKPYLFHADDIHQPFHINTPFIKNIDFLAQATLVSLSDRLKEVLRYYSWLDFVASTIPFFETLCRHWYDKEHTVKFEEIMFDIFDVILLAVQLGGNFKKISENTLKHALHRAIKHNIQRSALKQFMLMELLAQSADAGKKMTWLAVKEFTSFLCPLQPTGSLLISLTQKVQKKVHDTILIANGAIKSEARRKKLLRRRWKVNIDSNALEPQTSGILIDKTFQPPNHYIAIDNDYFRVFKDKDGGEWRIMNHQEHHEKNFAVPVTRSVSGGWIAGMSELSGRLAPSFDHYFPADHITTGLESIKSEPMRVMADPEPDGGDLINFHKTILKFYLYKNDYVRELIENKAHREHFLMGFHQTFFFREEILSSIKTNGYSHDENFMVSAIRALKKKQEGIMRFRAVCAWRNKFDASPESYFALRIDIGKNIFIIDLKEMRESFETMDNRDVFTENEWLMMFNSYPLDFELIKFKDFDFLEDAQYFTYREAISPSVIINNAYLLKEPAWYKPSLLTNEHSSHMKKYSLGHAGAHEIRFAARALRIESTHIALPEQYPLDILVKCNRLEEDSAKRLLRMITDAKKSNLNSQAFLINKQRLSTTESLLKVNDGILVGIYNTSGCLEHLLLSIKHGRFVGVGNSFFDSALPARASIVIAEQMGNFQGGFLRLHGKEQNFFVIVGEAFGSTIYTPPLLDDIPRETVPIYLSDGSKAGYREQAVSRKKLLLGKDCHIELINGVVSRLRIKLHGAPFNVNHMDAIEFSDIIRGLPFLEAPDFDLHNLESIDLYSCYSGFGRRYSSAQILADELGIKVKAYPFTVTDGGRVEQRRPEWFTWFTPDERRWGASSVSPQNALKFNRKEYKQTQKIHRRLHDIMDFVLRMNQKFSLTREKREDLPNVTEKVFSDSTRQITDTTDVWPVPLLYFDIFQLLFNKSPDIPSAVGDIKLSEHSRQVLQNIISDYNLGDEEESIFIQQAFLDMLLSVDEFKYLSDWFTVAAEYDVSSIIEPDAP
ncbi:hypothetical protein [Sodalis sp. dw_96]|uniref:hypothetical protein n=1 Tax=Sodalis sp. dw_96 TaxID=2719794 RepID=UPI001BD215C5|nr:hypothetical protein [Sodalis sp. dw_96]